MDKSSLRVGILAAVVYFSQGALGVSGIALPLYLRSLHYSIADIAVLSSVVAFPWVLKVIYGVVSDGVPLFGYRRKSYLYLCCAVSAVGWILLGVLPGLKFFIFVVLILANFGFAATDVIVDGYIVENSAAETASLFQSIAWGSRSVGAILCGVLGGWLVTRLDFQSIFILTALLPLGVMLCLGFMHEEKQPAKIFPNLWGQFHLSLRVITQPNLISFMLLLVLMTAPSCFAMPYFFYMKETLQFDEMFLGILVSLGWTGALLGSVLYPVISGKMTQKRLLVCAVFLNALNAWATLLIASKMSAVIIIVVGGILGGLSLLPLMSAAAILTHKTNVEGTVFAILMSVYNLGQISFGFVGGHVFAYFGMNRLILASGALILAGLFVLRFVSIDETRDSRGEAFL